MNLKTNNTPESAMALRAGEGRESGSAQRDGDGDKRGLVRWLALLALPFGLVVEAYIGYRVWMQPMGALPFLFCALLGALLTGIGLARLDGNNARLSFWLYAGLTLFIPVYGVLGSCLTVFYQRRDVKRDLANRYKDYIDSEAEEGYEVDTVVSSVDQMIHRELGIQSYMDIMRGPDRILKKALIGKILSEWTPNGVPLLKQALCDAEYEIRSYASTGLTAIEDRISKRILELQKFIAEDSADVSLKLELVRVYLRYAESGLLDRGSIEHYVLMAREVLDERALAFAAEDERHFETLLLRGQVARLLGDTDAEQAAYGEILRRDPDHQETLIHQCALDFAVRNFAELRAGCRRISPQKMLENSALEAVQMWAGNSPAAESGARA